MAIAKTDWVVEEAKKRWVGRAGEVYAWSGFAVMWLFWFSFVVFFAQPSRLLAYWPLPTVDFGSAIDSHALSAVIDVALIGLFGLQHSVMARPWFKTWWARSVPEAFERCTYVHMANVSLFALIIFWQPIPIEVWSVHNEYLRDATWVAFGMGWLILFVGAWSFGILNLLGVDQMRRWSRGLPPTQPALRTNALYRWLRHPMYVGVLMGIWITPRMTVGHILLATGLTLYVVIGKRYEERDLERKFGARYRRCVKAGAIIPH